MTNDAPWVYSAGIDIGAGAVKVVITKSRGGEQGEIVTRVCERIRRRNVYELAERVFDDACKSAGLKPDKLVYVASTGDGEAAEKFATGHFYSMTTHARGALFLDNDARAVLDIGALHARAIKIDDRSKVLNHRMTSQCASGTGQFVENIARYLGVPLEDVGGLSLKATAPEQVSGICAVLAETDVINMVSRGVSTQDILKGIHQSIAGRLGKLLRAIKAEHTVFVSGGMALDEGMITALREALATDRGVPLKVVANADSIFAGALGAALLGAYRRHQLDRRGGAAQTNSGGTHERAA
ncbi:MAG: benzoyl-CoA reductase subunit D [Deltaproteobacteria bacterium]|nr:benzoyl-CoA reductase subunit D [Deltaproteobacteria bacterium]